MEGNNAKLKNLAEGLLKLRNAEEITAFLSDLLTHPEIETLALRIQIVAMLAKGLPYTQIARETGASSATIAKVSENYKYGNDGYKLVLSRLAKKS